MFYVEDDHDAIISKRIWECVQLEIKRRKKYLEEHGTNSYSHRPESNPFASKIICGDCNKVFARKGWRSSTGVDRKVWQCSERYKVKGVMGCANRHVEEETLIKAYLMAWNCTGGEPRGFHGAVDGTAAEREPVGRLSGREVHRIHRWGRTSDEDGYGLHAENAGPHQGF